mgnify:CR=1 FL=1
MPSEKSSVSGMCPYLPSCIYPLTIEPHHQYVRGNLFNEQFDIFLQHRDLLIFQQHQTVFMSTLIFTAKNQFAREPKLLKLL